MVHRVKYGKLACRPSLLITRRAVGLLMALTALAGVGADGKAIVDAYNKM